MNNRDIHIQEAIAILKERYDASLSEIVDAFHGEISIPANIYASDLTPLEATSSFLSSEKDFGEKDIAEALKRPKSTIQNALKNANKKGIVAKEDNSTIRIPLSAFDTEMSPAEAVVYALHKQGLRNADIADAIGKDQRNVWQLLNRAKKRGESDE